jgi:uncharacterized protein
MKILLPERAPLVSHPVANILRQYKTIAVVGLSSDPSRPSNGVAAYMQRAGYRIVPVNPNESEVLGEKSFARLEDVPEAIEIVDVFRRADQIAPVVDSAIRVGAKVLWLQLGIVDERAAEKARAAGLMVVMDACILVEHRRHRAERYVGHGADIV